MLLNAATATTAVSEAVSGFSENIGPGLLLMVLGMAVVFTTLIVIWLVMEAVGALFARKDRADKKKRRGCPPELTPEQPPSVLPDATIANAGGGVRDEALVAAITAAISAHTGRPAFAFRVVSFRARV